MPHVKSLHHAALAVNALATFARGASTRKRVRAPLARSYYYQGELRTRCPNPEQPEVAPAEQAMWNEFKAFLIKQNMLALAIAVVIGAATNDVVQGLVNDFIMPVINAISPTKAWAELRFPSSGPVQFTYGHFLSVLLKFAIVGFICWRLTLALIKPPKAEEKPATRECPFCRQTIDARATRCAHCTSELSAAA